MTYGPPPKHDRVYGSFLSIDHTDLLGFFVVSDTCHVGHIRRHRLYLVHEGVSNSRVILHTMK